MSDDADEADDAAVDGWLDASRAALTAARGDPARIEAAIASLAGAAARDLSFSPTIVWDYLTVSTPGLLGEAGFDDAEVDALMPTIDRAIAAGFAEPA